MSPRLLLLILALSCSLDVARGLGGNETVPGEEGAGDPAWATVDGESNNGTEASGGLEPPLAGFTDGVGVFERFDVPEGGPIPVGRLSPERVASIMLGRHNSARGGVSRPCTAADMRRVYWSSSLARMAQAYANRCQWAHNPNRDGSGENIYAAGSSSPIDHARDAPGALNNAMTAWVREVQWYNYYNGRCSSGKMCGHYTQVVWSQTTLVGCGVARCGRMGGLNWNMNALFVVCNYKSPGNWVGRKPFVLGKKCALCNGNCSQGLCGGGTRSASTPYDRSCGNGGGPSNPSPTPSPAPRARFKTWDRSCVSYYNKQGCEEERKGWGGQVCTWHGRYCRVKSKYSGQRPSLYDARRKCNRRSGSRWKCQAFREASGRQACSYEYSRRPNRCVLR